MSEATPVIVEKGERDDPRAPSTFFVGAISVLLLVAVAIGLDGLHRAEAQRENQRKVVEVEPTRRLELEAVQRRRLAEYRWIDHESGRVAIPLERAIELLVAESGADAGGER